MSLLILAFAPVLIILFYVYYRDKYEKEPLLTLFLALFFGGLTVIPILFVEHFLDSFSTGMSQMVYAAYTSFVVASLTEEFFKFLVFLIFIWRHKDFNEKFDGIIYAVYISLGFALVENVFYVLGNGAGTGFLRALTAVPAHALFGVAMGFYLGKAKFANADQQTKYILFAIFIPIILHGIYDFILFSENLFLLLLFIPYLIYLWIVGFRQMREHVEDSAFKEPPLPPFNANI